MEINEIEIEGFSGEKSQQETSRDLNPVELKSNAVALTGIAETEQPHLSSKLDPKLVTEVPPVGGKVAEAAAPVLPTGEANGPNIALPLRDEPPHSRSNFITRIRTLVSRILSQLSRVGENDRKQIETLKREYRVASRSASDMQIRIGNAAPWIAGVAFTVTVSQFLFKSPDDRGMMKFIGEQVPSVGNLVTSRYTAKQMEFTSIKELRNTEINLKNSKTQSESGSKQEILALFNSTLETQKKASSAS